MIGFPGIKINLGLHVIQKRADGYHNIETCFYPVPYGDIIEITEASHYKMHISGIPIPGNAESNICSKAFNIINQYHDIPAVNIHLHKIVPMGAGLGGGSADGAWVLKMLNEIFHLSITADTLHEYAAKLGSDCAFFLENMPKIGSQKGDVLESVAINLQNYHIYIICPDIHVSTPMAYAGITPAKPKNSISKILTTDIKSWKDTLINDFETSVFLLHPRIAAIKQKLYELGAVYASMSGSGSAVYGIFENKVNIDEYFQGCKILYIPQINK
ncbi:MAG: 4-(cytidine 5'-diphospho)-2-C-methyl-D-erythritol kinase [Cytophagales bacterium]|nr:4-(cytidine 5'-diphospho)-2-C-methyl-D-erythritol kinase [Cytophagales bacterium]